MLLCYWTHTFPILFHYIKLWMNSTYFFESYLLFILLLIIIPQFLIFFFFLIFSNNFSLCIGDLTYVGMIRVVVFLVEVVLKIESMIQTMVIFMEKRYFGNSKCPSYCCCCIIVCWGW